MSKSLEVTLNGGTEWLGSSRGPSATAEPVFPMNLVPIPTRLPAGSLTKASYNDPLYRLMSKWQTVATSQQSCWVLFTGQICTGECFWVTVMKCCCSDCVAMETVVTLEQFASEFLSLCLIVIITLTVMWKTVPVLHSSLWNSVVYDSLVQTLLGFVFLECALRLLNLHRKRYSFVWRDWCATARFGAVKSVVLACCLHLPVALCDEYVLYADMTVVGLPRWSNQRLDDLLLRAFYVCSFMFIFDTFVLPVRMALLGEWIKHGYSSYVVESCLINRSCVGWLVSFHPVVVASVIT